jgi:hypothetical protein
MAAALRAVILAHLVRREACADAETDADFILLARLAFDHLLYLSQDRFYVAHNNHGLFQSSGLMILCKEVPTMRHCSEAEALAKERFNAYLDRFFSKDGFHLEHSPGYQLSILELLEKINEAGGLSASMAARLQERIASARATLRWFDAMGSARLRRAGVLPLPPMESDVGLSTEAGYAFFRAPGCLAPPPRVSCSYLAQAAAFHSRVHKQADELTFYWWDRGGPVLIELGRFGYLGRLDPASALGQLGFPYSDPRRIYVESTRGQNSVEIDGISSSRRHVELYGSGIRAARTTDQGLFFAIGDVPRPPDFRHRRALILDPGRWLVVVDAISPQKKKRRHIFDQWFHLAPEAEVTGVGDDLVELGLRDARLTIRSLVGARAATFRGQSEPELVGWHAPRGGQFLPTTALRLRSEGEQAALVTLLTFDGVERGCVVPGSHGEQTIMWRDGSGAVTAMSLPAEGAPRLDRRADPDVLAACG